MKRKNILIVIFFIAIIFVMLIIPNNVIAVSNITSIEITNDIPQKYCTKVGI